jgi:hypothetical protein
VLSLHPLTGGEAEDTHSLDHSFRASLFTDEGVIGMSLGEVAKIHCSPDYAYGPGGFPAWGVSLAVCVLCLICIMFFLFSLVSAPNTIHPRLSFSQIMPNSELIFEIEVLSIE